MGTIEDRIKRIRKAEAASHTEASYLLPISDLQSLAVEHGTLDLYSWSWYLARTNGGEWEILTYGYA